MNIEQFVSESLKQVISGVALAQVFAKEKNSKINPRGYRTEGRDLIYIPDHGNAEWHGQQIEFDIAVTIAESEPVTDAIRVVGGPVGLGVEAGRKESTQVSRIRFAVTVFLPHQQ